MSRCYSLFVRRGMLGFLFLSFSSHVFGLEMGWVHPYFFGIGFNLPSVWLMGWFGSSFMFDLKFTYVGLDNYL